MYRIDTCCNCASVPTVNRAAAKRGGPKRSGGFREKPNPSRGIPAKVSSLALPFSSWITAIA